MSVAFSMMARLRHNLLLLLSPSYRHVRSRLDVIGQETADLQGLDFGRLAALQPHGDQCAGRDRHAIGYAGVWPEQPHPLPHALPPA